VRQRSRQASAAEVNRKGLKEEMKTKRRYGWKPDVPDHRDRIYRPRKSVQPPAELDMRAEQPPIFDQGQLGSCTGNGIAGELEAQELAQSDQLTVLSRLFIYYNERAMEHTVTEDAGASIRDGIKSVGQQGDCPEPEWPYNIAKFRTKPSAKCYQDAIKHKAVLYQRLTPISSQLKGCLASGYPFVFGFTVYESFEDPQVAKTGHAPMPKPGEQTLGGHAVMAVGYDDARQWFLVRNSWGPNWGLKGYFTLPYLYVTDHNLADDFWTIRVVS